MMQQAARKPAASPQKFRKMTWLETRNASCTTKHLSPAKAMAMCKPTKGVTSFKPEKHSRLSSVGSHILTVRTFVDQCGLSHDEVIRATEMPDKRAISSRAEVRLGGTEARFEGPNTHYVATGGMDVSSCGLTHDEIFRAQELPQHRAISNKPESGLGGCDARFEGVQTHYFRSQGADYMLGQTEFQADPSAVTFPKNNWLKNLWAVAGTAMEDREMRKCDAVMAPTLPVHKNLESKGSIVVKMDAEGGKRFTYQKPSVAAKLGANRTHEQWQAKGGASMRLEKHSRFSTHGSHFQPSKKH